MFDPRSLDAEIDAFAAEFGIDVVKSAHQAAFFVILRCRSQQGRLQSIVVLQAEQRDAGAFV